MEPYPKIQSVFKRDPATSYKTLLSEYSCTEFEYLRDAIWVFTEKVDGMNIRILISEDGLVSYRGRTDRAELPEQLHARLIELFEPRAEKLHTLFPKGICLYGEGYGARIQKGGGLYCPFQDFVLFDALHNHHWLDRDNLYALATEFKLDIVPIIGTGTFSTMSVMVSRGFQSRWGNFAAEGIVARPAVELLNRHGERIITKLKTKDFRRG